MRLQGTVALLTSASKGMGRALALAQQGVKDILIYVHGCR